MSDDWAKAAEEQEAKDLASKVQTLSIPEDGSNAKPAPATEAEETPSEASTEEALTAAEESLMRKVMRKGIIESKNNVEVYRKDPNNPLYSVKDFEALNLRKELLDGIYDMGFKLPSKIQETALPTLLADPQALGTPWRTLLHVTTISETGTTHYSRRSGKMILPHAYIVTAVAPAGNPTTTPKGPKKS
ncbi:ATP-dependent RNA helicase DDX19A-like [Penaeus indicus]|uniref:ATP-dependent RNA helicase DDX19A-like n=1 Tax=Penaeus indicus TaxID=29960 RepID=UPI00300BFC72